MSVNSWKYLLSSIVGILCGREIFRYFIYTNILKSYDFMCNYNIESKRVPEKKLLASNVFHYYPPANIKKSDHVSASLWPTEWILLDNVTISKYTCNESGWYFTF